MKAATTTPRTTLAKGAACGGCRARKVKCSGESPVCKTCVKHWVHEGRIDRDCCPVGTPRTAKGATKRKRRESADSDASMSSATATPLTFSAPYMSPPATPPLAAVVDETLPWFYDPLTLADVSPSQDLWEYLESYEAANDFATTPSLFDSYPTAAPATSLPTASPFIFAPSPSLLPPAKKLTDNVTNPILSAAEFEILLGKSMQYQKVAEPTPVATLPASTIPSTFRPTYNFDSGMTALADLAALFKLGIAAGAGAPGVPQERRVSTDMLHKRRESTGVKPSVESLDNIFLNEPYYHV